MAKTDKDESQSSTVRMIKSFGKNYLRSIAFSSPIVLALALAVVVALLVKGEVPSWFLSLIAFIMGFSGVIVAVKREMPTGFGSITGPFATVLGIVFTIILWGAALFGLLLPR